MYRLLTLEQTQLAQTHVLMGQQQNLMQQQPANHFLELVTTKQVMPDQPLLQTVPAHKVAAAKHTEPVMQQVVPADIIFPAVHAMHVQALQIRHKHLLVHKVVL